MGFGVEALAGTVSLELAKASTPSDFLKTRNDLRFELGYAKVICLNRLHLFCDKKGFDMRQFLNQV